MTSPTILTSRKTDNWRAIDRAMDRVADACKVRRLRTMRQFAEQEIILPSGPHQDERFKCDRNPWSGLWLDAIDSGLWRRFNLTGPSQAGKTLQGSAIPVVYHLMECRETVIYAAPTLDMAGDKWQQDVLPVIRASKYRDLLPDRGAGSKGGMANSIQFKHGPTLRFMTGGGDDKVRAGFTSRVVVITETDGLDEAGESSREADKISQLEARTNAFDDRARVYMECTTSTETGRTWRELKQGTNSKIIVPCPHCRNWVTPERDHLVGWQDAQDIITAGERAMLHCPSCGVGWTEPERTKANRMGRLIHREQKIADAGRIDGPLPKTNTLGFRFTAANNLLVTVAKVAQEEWSSPRNTDTALAEKKMRQFYWTLPSEAESVTLSEMNTAAITRRAIDIPRGRVPMGATHLTIGVDIGKWLCHWVAVAWLPGGTPHVVEYGRLECPSDQMAEEHAILTALREFRDKTCDAGWPSMQDDLPTFKPTYSLYDSGHWEATIVAFCFERPTTCRPCKGFGTSQIGSNRRKMRDPGYEEVAQPNGHSLIEINADHWKSQVHARLQTPAGQPGGLTMFKASAVDHLSFAKHLTAEKAVEEFVAGRGLVTRWEKVHKNNHFLDALALACVAGHGAGERIVVSAPPPVEPRPAQQEQRNTRPRDLPSWI
jgi:phage terminase large subunit GpA-like protein